MFQVGDVVRVRSWDDMKDEFGLDVEGDINCRFCFTRDMQKMCGKLYHVSKVKQDRWDERRTEVYLKERPMRTDTLAYAWCAGMLELAEENKNINIDNILAFV